eukprot:s234_g20.t1
MVMMVVAVASSSSSSSSRFVVVVLAERRASLRLRSVAEALGRQSQDASRSLVSETLAISETSEEAPEEETPGPILDPSQSSRAEDCADK